MLSLDRVNSIFEESSIIVEVTGISDRVNRTIANLNDVNRTRTIVYFFFFFPFFYFPSLERVVLHEYILRREDSQHSVTDSVGGRALELKRGNPVRDRVLEQALKLIRLS